MKLQRQHFLLSYFKTLTDGPSGVELTTSRMTAWCLTNWATSAPVRDEAKLTLCAVNWKKKKMIDTGTNKAHHSY